MTRMFDKGQTSEGRVVSRPGAYRWADRLPADRLDELARRAMAQLARNSIGQDATCAAPAPAPAPVTARAEPAQAQASAAVVAMANALADLDADVAEEMVAGLLDAGVDADGLFLDYLTPAARQLGRWWEADKMTFTDVTLAAARIRTVLRRLPESRPRAHRSDGRGAVFAAVPGEEHTLGVTMAAAYFRRRGWDISLHVGLDNRDLCRRILEDDRQIVGLSCSGRPGLAGLQRLVETLRDARPDLAILLSGSLAAEAANLPDLPRFDGVIAELGAAEAVLNAARRPLRESRVR